SKLSDIGIHPVKVITIGDDAKAIHQVLEEAIKQADIVLTTGGLGPTSDDITKKVVADFFDATMVIHEPTLNFIKKTFEKRNIPFSKSNYRQAEVPENCEVLFN